MMSNSKAFKREHGFTLFEVLIAITLMAIISYTVSMATIRSFNLSSSLNSEYDRTLNTIMSMKVIEQDIRHLFSPKFAVKKQNLQQRDDLDPTDPADQELLRLQNQGPAWFWSAPVRKDGLRRSRFQGSPNRISFITNGHQRYMQEARETDMLAIVWEIAADAKKNGMYQLIRTVSLNAFDYSESLREELMGKPVVVLSNISSGKFEFYRHDNKSWEAQWDSEADYVKDDNRYPELIRVTLEVPDPLNEAVLVPMTGVFRPNVIYNKEAESSVNNPGGR